MFYLLFVCFTCLRVVRIVWFRYCGCIIKLLISFKMKTVLSKQEGYLIISRIMYPVLCGFCRFIIDPPLLQIYLIHNWKPTLKYCKFLNRIIDFCFSFRTWKCMSSYSLKKRNFLNTFFCRRKNRWNCTRCIAKIWIDKFKYIIFWINLEQNYCSLIKYLLIDVLFKLLN